MHDEIFGIPRNEIYGIYYRISIALTPVPRKWSQRDFSSSDSVIPIPAVSPETKKGAGDAGLRLALGWPWKLG
jgi:hypothetical protein